MMRNIFNSLTPVAINHLLLCILKLSGPKVSPLQDFSNYLLFAKVPSTWCTMALDKYNVYFIFRNASDVISPDF